MINAIKKIVLQMTAVQFILDKWLSFTYEVTLCCHHFIKSRLKYPVPLLHNL